MIDPNSDGAIDPNSDRARHRQIADWLRARIANGELAPGAKLDSEKYLSQQNGVARSTVREAIATLRAEGLVETRRPKGTFVREKQPEELVDLKGGSVVRTRMPSPEERRKHDVTRGVPVLVVERAGKSKLYVGDRTALRVR
jgi:DNA-binding FadR family transcriptional regulator